MGWHAKIPGAEVLRGLRARNYSLGYREHWLYLFFLATTADEAAFRFLEHYAGDIDALTGKRVLFVTFYNEAHLHGETWIPSFWRDDERQSESCPLSLDSIFARNASDAFYRKLPSDSIELGATKGWLAETANHRIREDYDLVPDEIFVTRNRNPEWDVELFLRSMLYESNRFCEDTGLSQVNLPCILIMENLNCRDGWIMRVDGASTFARLRALVGSFVQQASSMPHFIEMSKRQANYQLLLAHRGAEAALAYVLEQISSGRSVDPVSRTFLAQLGDLPMAERISAVLADASRGSGLNEKKLRHLAKFRHWLGSYKMATAEVKQQLAADLTRRKGSIPSWLVGPRGRVADSLMNPDLIENHAKLADEIELAIRAADPQDRVERLRGTLTDVRAAIAAFEEFQQLPRTHSYHDLGIMRTLNASIPDIQSVVLREPPQESREIAEADAWTAISNVLSSDLASRVALRWHWHWDKRSPREIATALASIARVNGTHPAQIARDLSAYVELPDATRTSASATTASPELTRLQGSLGAIATLPPQQRGYALEAWFHQLVRIWAPSAQGPFRQTGEQIDGAFELLGWHFIYECKWQASPLGPRDGLSFRARVDQRAVGTLGFIVSMSGFTKEAVTQLESKERFNLLLMSAGDIQSILTRHSDLPSLIRRKRWHACCFGSLDFAA